MSNIESTDGFETSGGQTTGADRKTQAKEMVGQATEALKTEAQTFAQTAQERLRGEAQKRAETATKTLGDFASAIRRAGDELSQADQSPAARLVGQAADGLERLSLSLADKQPEDLLDAVRDFGRRHPMAFIAGGVLVGVALGRFVRASETDGQYGGGLSTSYPIATTYDDEDAGVGDGTTTVGETSSFAGDPGAAPTPAQGTDAEVETTTFAGLGEDTGATDVRDINTTGAGVGHADDDETETGSTTTPRPGV